MALVPFSMIGFSGACRPARRSGVGVTGPAADLLTTATQQRVRELLAAARAGNAQFPESHRIIHRGACRLRSIYE